MKNNINKVPSTVCCGCRACEQLCPTKSIMIKEDKEGFLAPVVNEDNCNNCGLCLKRCAQVNYTKGKQTDNYPKVYAAKINDKKLLKHSASGGFFTIIANYVLEQDGVVFGCAWSKELIAHHIMIDSKDKLHLLQGSKYVQSDTENTYCQVAECLKANRLVLYSGTPCQIGGLKTFLNKEYDNLITTDLVCHGVPSPRLFKKYIEWLGKRYGERIISYDFRNKERSGWGLMAKIKIKTKTRIKIKFLSANLDPYYKAFLDAKTYRECCYKCKYANGDRVGDITIADYWGIEKSHPKFYSLDGVSLVLINSAIGKKIFDERLNQFKFIETDIEDARRENQNLYTYVKRTDVRNSIFDNLNNSDFDNYIRFNLLTINSIKSRIKILIPYRLRVLLKVIKIALASSGKPSQRGQTLR